MAIKGAPTKWSDTDLRRRVNDPLAGLGNLREGISGVVSLCLFDTGQATARKDVPNYRLGKAI